MNEKKLSKLESEQVDEDFEKMLQEFIDQEFDADEDLDEDTTSDDSDTDEDYGAYQSSDGEHQSSESTDVAANENEDLSIRLGGERNYMPEITKVEVEIQPLLFGSLYVNGDVAVTIYGHEDSSFSDDRFQLNIFAEGCYPMANTKLYNQREHLSPTAITTTMMSRQIWLPGRYTLYVRDTSDDSLIRMPFSLDAELKATVSDPEPCKICSTDDILTQVIDGHDADWSTMALKPGAAQLRRFVVESRQLAVYNDYRQAMNGDPIRSKGHLLIAMRNDDLMDDLYSLHHIVAPDYDFNRIDCGTLFDAARNNPYEVLFEEMSVTGKNVFCLTNVGALLSTGGKIIVKKVLEKIRRDQRQYLLWLCGYKHDIDAVLNMYPSMKEFFPADRRLEQEPYKDFELVQAFFTELRYQSLYCSVEAMDGLARALLKGWQNGVLSTWSIDDIRRFIVEQVKPRYLARCYREIESDRLPDVEIDDLCFDQITSTEASTEQCFKDLEEMVGLDDVKKGIRAMADNTKFYAERRRRGLPTSQKAAFHCVFTGNPGTGKTTVAKKLGRIYRSLGLLSRGEVIAVDRTRLVGRYIGETEENMKTVLDEARGNVLFIDEAYTLYDGASDRKDFGARVIDSLLTVLSQPNPDMLVIFAGYLKEMDAMLNTNQGLTGRFPYKYQFADYNANQLYEIACSQLKRDAYILSPEADIQLRESVAKAYAQRDEHFSNARWVEQFVNNGIIPAMAGRISRTACDDYQTIEASDVCQAFIKFNPKATVLKPRHKVGFSA
jgi:AAA+ superfamily predicted ATPase